MPPTQKVPRNATLFEVAPSGTLSMAGVDLPETRASAYDISPERLRNAVDLLSAVAGCPPLAWHLHRLYNEAREAHAAEIARLLAADSEPRRRRTLAARLHMLAPEPTEGVAGWLESLSRRELRSVLKSAYAWLEEEPAWTTEEEHLPWSTSGSGAAFDYFRDWDPDDLLALGVKIVEGEHPGSTYFAASWSATPPPPTPPPLAAASGCGSEGRRDSSAVIRQSNRTTNFLPNRPARLAQRISISHWHRLKVKPPLMLLLAVSPDRLVTLSHSLDRAHITTLITAKEGAAKMRIAPLTKNLRCARLHPIRSAHRVTHAHEIPH